MLKAGSGALLVLATLTSAAMADCRYMAFRFDVRQNGSYSTTGVSTNGAGCSTRFWSAGTDHFTSGSIAARPSHGTLTERSALSFLYKPQRGFKGVDHYSLHICGVQGGGSGCATLTYNITVQ
jgi:hypothetical protein